MKTFHGPTPKQGKKAKKRHRGMARPDEPLARWCEIARVDCCTGRAEVRHHRILRSQGGGDEQENTMDICQACHTLVHARPSLAYAHGWLLHRAAS